MSLGISHISIRPATLGCWVKDQFTGTPVLLTSHEAIRYGRIGDPIVQPSTANGGSAKKDVIATVYRHIICDETTRNYINAAVAFPTDPSIVKRAVLGLGPNIPSKIQTRIDVGQEVMVSSAVGVTKGTISDKRASVRLPYDVNSVPASIHYSRQILVRFTPATAAERIPTGAAVFSKDHELIGIFFSKVLVDGSLFGVVSPIKRIFEDLELALLT